MEAHLKNLTLNDNSYIQALQHTDLGSFLRSQVSFVGFYDNWSRIIGGCMIKVPEEQRYKFVEYMNKIAGEKEKSLVRRFMNFMKELGFEDELVPYQKNEFSVALAKYIISIRDQIPKNDWFYILAMFSGVLYGKHLLDIHVLDYLFKNSEVDMSQVSFGFFDVREDAAQLLKLCEGQNEDTVLKGLNFGFDLVNKLYNDFATILVSSMPNKEVNEETTQVNEETTQVNEETTQVNEETTQVNEETTQVNEETTQVNEETTTESIQEVINDLDDEKINQIGDDVEDDNSIDENDLLAALKLVQEDEGEYDEAELLDTLNEKNEEEDDLYA